MYIFVEYILLNHNTFFVNIVYIIFHQTFMLFLYYFTVILGNAYLAMYFSVEADPKSLQAAASAYSQAVSDIQNTISTI